MSSEHEEIAERIEDGTYFEEARKWYNQIYISPISERISFIIITGFSIFIFIVAFLALLYLLPIKPRIPFVYHAKDMFHETPRMERLKKASEPPNPSLVNYYLGTYVEMRESYSEATYVLNQNFVKEYSDPRVFNEYFRMTSPNNPRSPIRQYGQYSKIGAVVRGIKYDRTTEPARAIVRFSTIIVEPSDKTVTEWTADIEFYYTDLIERDVINEDTGEIYLEYDEPTFQVVGYEVREYIPIKEEQ